MIRLDTPAARAFAGVSAAAATVFAIRRLTRTEYSFRDRTVVITGARGLALALARGFVDEGARVWLVARSMDELSQASDELAARGGWVRTVCADIRRPDHVSRVIEVGPVEHAKLEDFQDAMATHFWGPLDMIRACLPHLRRGGEGRIVNIASVGGRIAVPHLAAYTASKFALVGLSEALRAELRKEGVFVTTVTPGLMRTGSYVNVKLRGRHPDELRWFTAMSATPLTSMRADRAAAKILQACREGRATITPGVQAKLAVMAHALAPNLYASINALVDRALLPQPIEAGERARMATDVDPGAVKTLLSEGTRRSYHQPQPAW
jgi:short-subunit dehydrogenase